ISTLKSVDESVAEDVPAKEPQVDAEEADMQRALEESLKSMHDVPRGPLPSVVIREPEPGKYQPLPEVLGKGKAKVTEEQVTHDLLSLQKPKRKSPADQYIFQRRTSTSTGSPGHDESSSLYAELGLLDSEEESQELVPGADAGGKGEGQARPDPGAQAEGQAGPDLGAQDEGQAGSNPDEQSEDHAGPDPGNAGTNEQPMPNLVVHAGSDREHMDLDVDDVSPQPSTEQMDEGFTATAYPKVQENLKLTVKEQVLLEEPASSSGTLSSLQHLSKDLSFDDLFFSDKPSEADNDKATAKTKVKSIGSVTIQQDMSSIPPMTSSIIDLTSRPESPKSWGTSVYTGIIRHTPPQVRKAVNEVVTDAVDWAMQAPLRNRFRDLPEADMKEILHQRMWESDSYKSHEDHMQLYEALEKSMNRDHSEKLAKDLAEVRKKKKKSRESPKTPHGALPHQPPPPPPLAGPSGASGAPGSSGSSQVLPSPPPPPSPSTNQESQSKASAAPSSSKTATSSSNDEDIGSAYIPKVNLRQDWWKSLEEERPATPEPAWSIPSFDVPVPTNNWASALASNYSPPPEDSLLAQTGDIAMFMDWFCDRSAVSTHMWILSVVRIEVFSMYGYDYIKKIVLRHADLNEHVIAERDFKYLYPSDFEDIHLVIRQRVEDFQLRIESYQTQLNLTKPRWDATGFEYKHDYTVIDSPRAVTFRDRYGVQMMMRFNEIHKFSDGTLQQIDEALDYRVKVFKINRMNPGLNTSEDGNPARANIKQALANELTDAFAKPFEAVFILQRGTVVLATLFNESEQRHFRSFITNVYLQESRRLQLLDKEMSIHNSMLTLHTHYTAKRPTTQLPQL
nr:hypothetical protein [Tanacetum cinerariifolium]